MNWNPVHYFLKRYHSPNLQPNELKQMLNLWLPFILNRIKIQSISDDFTNIHVLLKHSFWNRNPNKSVWGGSIASVLDPFFPIMIKQIILRKGMHTDFFSKSVNVDFIKQVQSNILFHFTITTTEIASAEKALQHEGKYEGWHSVSGEDSNGNICVKGKIQVYLRKR